MEGKVVFVTGGGRGIGRAIAHGFGREGARVAVAARTLSDVESVAAEITSAGGAALALQCDITDEQAVQQATAKTLEAFGRIDVLVNNAGVGSLRPIHGISRESWDRVIAVNLTGSFLCTKHVWKTMQAQRDGCVINVNSLAGRRGVANLAAYCASKWGQIGLTLSAADEGRQFGIRVNAIAPGKGDTDFRKAIAEDKSRILTAEDHVGVCLFLASDAARYITGQVIELDWFGPENGHPVGSSPAADRRGSHHR